MPVKLSVFPVVALVLAFVPPAYAQIQRCSETGSIRSATKAIGGNLETVTFEFVGRGLPQKAEVRDVKPPFENDADKTLHIRGRAFKEVFFAIVPWTCDIRENFRAKTTTIRDIKQTEQFEGYVSYVIGYTARSKYVGKKIITGQKTTKFIVQFKR